MYNRKSLLIVLPLIALVLMSCQLGTVTLNTNAVRGSGNVTSEDRSVSDIERVSLMGTGDLTVIQGDTEGLTIEAEDNILPLLTSDMNGRELQLGVKKGTSISPTKPIRYTLKVKSLTRISVSGSGNVNSDKLDVQDFALDIAGSGNMDMQDLTAGKLTAKTSGSGNFNMAGKVQSQDITITGAGNYKAEDLQSTQTSVTISGSGNVTVWASDSLDIHITGQGDVRYYGKPTISQSISGSGSIKSLGEK
jgi:hypothetical protein